MRNSLLFVLTITGCSPAPVPEGTTGDMATMNLAGQIIGLDQQPLAGIAVSLCQGACRDTTTGPRGEFAFSAVNGDFYTLRARKPGTTEYADLDFPLYLRSDGYPLRPLLLPRIGAGAALPADARSFAVDPALTLTLDGSPLTLPQGGPASRLGGVRIPAALFPDFCLPTARVLAMWAFAPTGVTSAAPISISLSDTLGLPAKMPVDFLEIDPKDGRPRVAARGAVSADGTQILTSPGQGLRRLGWLLAAVYQGGG